MKIGEKNYLLAEKRGCNFAPGDASTKGSDIGNYRVFICSSIGMAKRFAETSLGTTAACT